jgi:IQ calmodulin-binding motif
MRAKHLPHFVITLFIFLFGNAVLLCSCNKDHITAMTPGYKPVDRGALGYNNLDRKSSPSGCFSCCSSSALDAVVHTDAAPPGPARTSKHIEKISTKDIPTTIESSLTLTTATETDFPIREVSNAASVAVHHQERETHSKRVAERESATKIQTAVRRRNAKKQLVALKEEEARNRRATEQKAATKIQTAARKHNAKKQLVALKEEEARNRRATEQKAATKIQTAVRKHNAENQLAALVLEKKAEESFSTPLKKKGPPHTAANIQTTPPVGRYKIMQSQDEQSTGAQSAPVGRYKAMQNQDEQNESVRSAPVGRYKAMQNQDEQSESVPSAPVGRYKAMQNQDERSTSARSAPVVGRRTIARQSEGKQGMSPRSVPVRGYAARHGVVDGAEENTLDISYDSSIASTESFGFSKDTTKIEFSGIKTVSKRDAEAGAAIEYHARRHHTDERGGQGIKAGGSTKSAPPVAGHRTTGGQDMQTMSTWSAPIGDHATRQSRVDDHAQGVNRVIARYMKSRMQQAKSRLKQDKTRVILPASRILLPHNHDEEDISNSFASSVGEWSSDEESVTEHIASDGRLGAQEIPESTARTTDESEGSNYSENTDEDGIIEKEYKLLRN